MKNVLKAEFFKLRKAKSTYICLGILVAYSLFLVLMYLWIQYFAESLFGGESADIGMAGVIPQFTASGALSFFGTSNSFMIATIMVCVIAARFYAGENKSGVLRNSLTVGVSRTEVYAAKFIMTMILAAAAYLIMVVIHMVVFGISGGWGSVNPGVFLGYMALQLLLFFSVAGLVFLLSIALRNSGGTLGLTIGICYLFTFLSLIASIGDTLAMVDGGEVAPVFKVISELCMFFPPTLITRVSAMDLSPLRLVQAAAAGVVTLGASFGVGWLVFTRRDHK